MAAFKNTGFLSTYGEASYLTHHYKELGVLYFQGGDWDKPGAK
jgi:hypothetical protein